MPMLEVEISGSYRNQKEGLVDYDKEKILIPVCDDEWIKSNIMNRCLRRHFSTKKDAPRFDSNYRCSIDKVTRVKDKSPSFLGKNIRDLTHEEAQEVAMFYNLSSVPLYKDTDLRETKNVLYKEYCKHVLKLEITSEVDIASAPDVIIPEDNSSQAKATVDVVDIEKALDKVAEEEKANVEGQTASNAETKTVSKLNK